MTYCLGIKTQEGLVALADTRITSGSQTTTSRKITTHTIGHNSVFLMTSGLRSVRDKAVTYFEEALASGNFQYEKMYQAVNAFGQILRRVSDEDRNALSASGLFFNLYTIVGGQLHGDASHKLFLLYPEGNWIEIGEATPFTIIGNTGYGQPILNRAITYQSSLRYALKTGLLSFDATRVSANDVGYPIDVAIFKAGSWQIVEQRFDYEDLKHITESWAEMLRQNVKDLNDEWMNALYI
ncbi:MAG TPA: peptidase [Cytophagales bacterium]|nr:peptidase [Cytophagales bacterium]